MVCHICTWNTCFDVLGLHHLIKSWNPNQFRLPRIVMHVASIPFGTKYTIMCEYVYYSPWKLTTPSSPSFRPLTSMHSCCPPHVEETGARQPWAKGTEKREGTPANCKMNHLWFNKLKEGNLVGLLFAKKRPEWGQPWDRKLIYIVWLFQITSDLQASYSKMKEQNWNKAVPYYGKASSDSKLAANIW